MHGSKTGLARVREAFVTCADVIAIGLFACLGALFLGMACLVELTVLAVAVPARSLFDRLGRSLASYGPVYAFAVVAFLLAASLPALAAETTVDVGAFVVSLTELAVAVAGVVAAWLFALLRSFLKSKTSLYSQEIDAHVRAYFDEILHKGLAYGADKVKDAVLTEGKLEVDVKSELLAHALEFVVAAGPAAMKRLGVDAEHVESMLRARLPDDAVFPAAPAVRLAE